MQMTRPAKQLLIICTSGLLIVSFAISFCVIVHTRTVYSVDLDSIVREGDFVPYVAYRSNMKSWWLPFVTLRVEKPPHNLLVKHYDHTVKRSHEGYTEFTIQRLEILYESGDAERIAIIDDESTWLTFPVDRGQTRISAAIKRNEDFALSYSGTARDLEGNLTPFKFSVEYDYDSTERVVYTIFQYRV